MKEKGKNLKEDRRKRKNKRKTGRKKVKKKNRRWKESHYVSLVQQSVL
jgi:hypothetical protein